MQTNIVLNEGTEMIVTMTEEELHAKIIDKHDKDGNFIDVPCYVYILGGTGKIKKVNKNIKLYTKRILFFYEI